MFRFGKRNVIKQGGSYMISLPMQWMRSMNSDIKTVMVEMDGENGLRISPRQNGNSCLTNL